MKSEQKKHLDYTLDSAEERVALVNQILEENDYQVTANYAEILADYIVAPSTPEEKKSKEILTDNRMYTINKRETSYEGLVSGFENGEDGIWNITINDKNVLLTHKREITAEEASNIEPLRTLKQNIAEVEAAMASATGRRKYLLKKQIIEMRQEQYVIKDLFKPVTGASKITRSMRHTDLGETITIDKKHTPHSNGLISFFNKKHLSALLCNYSALKEDADGNFTSDLYYLMQDLDGLIERALDGSLLYWILIYKIDGVSNEDIAEKIFELFGKKHSIQHISVLWRNKIPSLLAEKAVEEYLTWHYSNIERGEWKQCSRCGEWKLALNRFFSKNGTSRDGLYSICKKCRNARKGM